MLQNVLSWAAENDVKINFQKIDGSIVAVVQKDDICSGICLIEADGRIDQTVFDFAQHLLYPAIDAIRLEHTKHPKPQEQP